MINTTLFEIPVYTCDQDELVKRITAHVDKAMASVYGVGTEFWKQQREDELQRHLYPVRYNELVGVLEVHRLGSQLRADLWFSEKPKVVIGSKQKPRIRWRGKLLEKHYDCSKTSSQDVFNDFRAALGKVVRQHGSLKRRHVDFEAFDRTGPHTDWCGLLAAKYGS